MKGRDYTIVIVIVLGGVFLSLLAGCLGGAIAGALANKYYTRQAPEFAPPRFEEEWPLVPPERPTRPEDVPMPHLPPEGALIQMVVPDSPADKAGLQPGDVILSVDGEEVTIDNPLHEIIREYEPGDRVTIVYWRAGEEDDTRVRLAEHPNEEDVAFLGVLFGMIDEEMQPRRRGD